uniref:Protein Wnt n=1 Tax=Anopheles dirus TaxID=7168 RepID=A0A182N8X7_9DIPT
MPNVKAACSSLGIKSPFIVFRSEQEVLSNNSVLLNLTDIRNKLKSVHNLDHFIRPIDGSNDNKNSRKDQTAGKGGGGVGRLGSVGSGPPPAAPPPVFSAESAFGGGNVSITFLTTVAPSFVNHFEKSGSADDGLEQAGLRPSSSMRSKLPAPSVMGSADHMISDDDGGVGPGSKKERKYIIPLALKTSTNGEKEKTSSVFHGSSTNIDDLKRHILMLQNLTQSDKNFQSKFVVFPSLQKNGTAGPVASPGATATPVLLTPVTVSPRHPPPGAGSAPKDVREYRNAAPTGRGPTRKGQAANTTNNRSAMRSQISASINMPKKAFPDSHDILSDRKEGGGLQAYKAEKITIVPQVFLQNDQTSEAVSDKVDNLNEHASRVAADGTKMTAASPFEGSHPAFGRARETKEKNAVRKFGHKSMTSAGGAEGNGTRNNHTGVTTPHMKPSSAGVRRGNDFPISAGSVEIGGQPLGGTGHGSLLPNGTAERPGRKGDGKKKQRKNGKRRGGPKQTIKLNGAKEQPKTVILNDDASVEMDGPERAAGDGNRDEPFGRQPGKPGRATVATGSRKRSSSARVRRNDNGGRQGPGPDKQQPYASPTGRLHAGLGRTMAVGSAESLAGAQRTADPLPDEETGENNNRSHNYRNRTLSGDGSEKDIVDLNPDLCYTLGALSGGQQKLCAQHTSIMPAISRGARAAIQECKHQFRNRRWNCSIVNDDTVFGPVSNIGE